MDNILTLRGAALSKFKTIGAFADAMHWKRSKASRILNEEQTLTVEDAQQIAEILGIKSQDVFMQIFFGEMSTKWTDKSA